MSIKLAFGRGIVTMNTATAFSDFVSARNMLAKFKVLIITLVAALFLCVSIPAYAAAPVNPIIDDNGVDLSTGTLSAQVVSLSIGNSSSGITHDSSGFGLFTGSNYGGNLYSELTGIGSYVVTLSIGNNTEIFTRANSSSPYVAQDGSASTLTFSSGDNAWYYTTEGGTVAKFDKNLALGSGSLADSGMLTTITKADGEVISITYSSVGYSHRPITVSSTLGWAIKYLYTSGTRTGARVYNMASDYCSLTSESCTSFSSDRVMTNSGTTSYTVTDPTNHTTTYNYDSGTSLQSIITPEGVTKTIAYSGGQVSSVTIGSSVWTYSYSYSGNNIITTVTDPASKSRQVTYDTANYRLVSYRDELNRTTSYTYDSNNRLLRVIAPDATYSGATLTGGYTEYSYDSRNNVTATSTYPKGGGTAITTSATYASTCSNVKTCNKPLTTTDAGGVTTTYVYDSSHGGVTSVYRAAVGSVQSEIRYGYSQLTPYIKNSSGSLVSQPSVWRLTSVASCMTAHLNSCYGGVDDRKVTIAYNSNNLLPTDVTTTYGDAITSTISSYTVKRNYDARGNLTSVEGAKTGAYDTSYYFYDAQGRMTGAIGIDPDGSGSRPRPATRITYNADGKTVTTETGTVTGTGSSDLSSMTPLSKSTTDYDSTTGLAKAFKTYGYESGAYVLKTLSQTSYDSRFMTDCVVARIDPNTSLSTSACSNTQVGATKDRISKYGYDDSGAVLTVTSGYNTSSTITETSTYDSTNGNLLTLSDGKGNKTTYEYDVFNRLKKTRYPTASSGSTSSSTDYEEITYTGARQTALRRRDGQSISLSYDALGRLSSTSGAITQSFSYNNFNLITSHTHNSQTNSYIYNSAGWLKQETQPMGAVGYGYDVYGRRTVLFYPGSFYLTYEYTNGNELLSIKENGSTEIASFSYDNQGRRSGLTQGGSQSTTYGYDSLSRLTSLAIPGNTTSLSYTTQNEISVRGHSNTSFTHSPSAKNISYTLNGLNQISAIGGTSLTYDDRGNLTGDGGGSYSYNVNNFLTSATQSGVTSTLTYDASDRLLSIAKSGTTTKFLYDGSDLIAEYDGSGTLLRRYVHGPGMDEPLVWYEGSGTSTKYYLHADERGSVVSTTNSSGTTLNINTFDEYGLMSSSNATYASRFSYTGQTWLPEIGMYYYKARMYHPAIGRFMQPDPIGYGDGLNMYAYVHGDPVNSTDPWGLAAGDVLIVPGTRKPKKHDESDLADNMDGGANATVYEGVTNTYDSAKDEVVVWAPRRPLTKRGTSARLNVSLSWSELQTSQPECFETDEIICLAMKAKDGDSQECINARWELYLAAGGGLVAGAGTISARQAARKGQSLNPWGMFALVLGDLVAAASIIYTYSVVLNVCDEE